MTKVAVWSNSSIAKTGFGKHARILIEWLLDHGYEVIELAAGVAEDNKVTELFPWSVFGLTPSNQERIKQEKDSGHEQAIGYGRLLVEEVILREKPDIIVAIEDSWAFTNLPARPVVRQNPDSWIFWSPIDSTPLMETQISFFKSIKHAAVKATFAQKELEKEGIKSYFWPALVDVSHMRPDKAAGLALRRKSGIPDETLVFGFVFRNQLRKLVIPQFQALKMFLDKYPGKAKLVFHTNPFEPGQWNCVRHAKMENVEDSIFYTTICPTCKNITFGPALIEKKICPCGRGELHHPSPEHGVAEEELNGIYSSFDGYIQSATSGGYEMCVAESLLAGIPTACTNYSFGEMFVDSGFVYPLPFNTYHVHDTGYTKAHTTPEGIFSFMEHVANSSPQEKEELKRGQIEWAREFTDNDKICSQVAALIDSLPPAKYDWSFPNPAPPMPQDEKDEEFTDSLLYSFFGEIYPSFREEILTALKNGQTRDGVYKRIQEILASKKKSPKDCIIDSPNKKTLLRAETKEEAFLLGSKIKDLEGDIYLLVPSSAKIFVEHLPVKLIFSDMLTDTNFTGLLDEIP